MKLLALFIAILGLSLGLGNNNYNIELAHAALPGGQEKVILYERDISKLDGFPLEVKEEILKIDTPEAFQFNPNHPDSKARANFYKGLKFYETKYLNRYYIYTWDNPYETKYQITSSDKLDRALMWENQQITYAFDGNYLAEPYNPATGQGNNNLKTGSVPINGPAGDNYLGYNTGHMEVQSGKFKGKMFEWRYMGYTFNGTVMSNPHFPADVPSSKKLVDKNIIVRWWDAPYNLGDPSAYTPGRQDIIGDEVRKEWFENYLFAQRPEFVAKAREKGAKAGEEWAYWNQRLMWMTDPIRGNGLLMEWHQSSLGYFHGSITLNATSPKRNVRMVELAIYDSDGNFVANVIRSEATDGELKPVFNYKTTTLTPGKTYRLRAKIKNMSPYQTVTNPTMAQILVALDNNVGAKEPVFDSDAIIDSYNPLDDVMQGNRYGHFQWEYTVPSVTKNKIQLISTLPGDYYENFDNYDTDDDTLFLEFDITQEDMALDDFVELIDYRGNVTDVVVPGEPYSIRYKVSKVSGETPVGDSNNPNNPYATIDVKVEDGLSSTNMIAEAKSTLKPNSSVNITTEQQIVPTGSYIKACAIINEKHHLNGQNADLSNDGPVCRAWSSTLDFSIPTFEIVPSSLTLPYRQTSSNESVSFNFSVQLASAENQSKNVLVTLSKETRANRWTVLKSENVWVSSSIRSDLVWTIDNLPISVGTLRYKVEVNPAPRQYIESNPDVANVYANNVQTSTLTVRENNRPYDCAVVNNKNTWSQQYYVYEWSGHVESFDCSYTTCSSTTCYSTGNGVTFCFCSNYTTVHQTCSYCVTDWTTTTYPSISHYESFKITDVYFKSKLTTDTQGGWVNIINQPGKIKAGYGFELRITTKYETNRYSSAPKGWTTRCSGKYVSPTYHTVSAPNVVTLTMPYKDTLGQPVSYNLNGSASGSWDNRTAQYTLPYRDAFGIKSVPQIFVNETAKDGLYPMQISTPETFMGSPDKPYSKYLCDKKTVYLQVIGGGSDDLKTHIVQ